MADKYDKDARSEKKTEKTEKTGKPEGKKLSREEELAYHQGSLQALAAEYNELVKMLKTVEAIMKAHMERMQQLGVKFEKVDKK